MCTRRTFLLFVCSLQLLTIIERQIFDFLGFMWAPIVANFFHIIFIIFGFFGAYQFHAKYLISYSIWNFVWIGWNSFLICFYLNVGIFDRDSDLLNFGTGSVSWFEVNGPGCKPTYPTNLTTIEDPFRPIRPESVDGCLLEYPIVEVIHSSVQNILALLGLIGACCIGKILWDDDDDFEFMGCDAKSPQHTSVHPMYVSYSSIPAPGSGSSLKINSIKKDPLKDQHHHVVVTSSNNNNSNTNSISSAYIKTHHHHDSEDMNPTTVINNHHHKQQLSHFDSRNNLLISKSASTQAMMKPNHQMVHSGSNRMDMRYTEIPDDDGTSSQRSYFLPSSSTASTALASPSSTNKLMAVNLQQQQLITRSFGVQHNPLNRLMSDDGKDELRWNKNKHHQVDQRPDNSGQKMIPNLSSANNQHQSSSDVNKYLSSQISPPPRTSSQQHQQHPVNRSPNLNQMPRRRASQQHSHNHNHQHHHQLEQSHSNTKLSSNANFCDQIRDRPPPSSSGHCNINQFIPEYHHSPNPLPAIPPHMLQHPMMMYRVRSQDRIINRLKRQSGSHPNDSTSHENQRPRSFCNNMVNYEDYKDPSVH